MEDIVVYTPDYKGKKEYVSTKENKDKENLDKTENFYKDTKMYINYKQEYIDYLIDNGYAVGTSDSYSSSIERVMSFENIGDWQGIVNNINLLIRDYGDGGVKEELGDLSHKSVINALKRFNEFLEDSNYKINTNVSNNFAKNIKYKEVEVNDINWHTIK